MPTSGAPARLTDSRVIASAFRRGRSNRSSTCGDCSNPPCRLPPAPRSMKAVRFRSYDGWCSVPGRRMTAEGEPPQKGDTPLARSTAASPLWIAKTVCGHSLGQGQFAPKREPCLLGKNWAAATTSGQPVIHGSPVGGRDGWRTRCTGDGLRMRVFGIMTGKVSSKESTH